MTARRAAACAALIAAAVAAGGCASTSKRTSSNDDVAPAGSTERGPRQKLSVEIEGLGGALSGLVETRSLEGSVVKQNVESVLSIWAARKEKDLTVRRIRQLHARAPDEIRRALQPFGYYKPTIDASLEREDGHDGGVRAGGDGGGSGDSGGGRGSEGEWIARYRIDPGPAVPVSSVDLRVTGEGESDWAFRDDVASFPLRSGDPLSHPLYERGKASFADTAAERGYLDARFEESEVRVDLGTYTAAITVHYATGPRYLFGPVTFHQDVLDPRLLRGYVTWEQGDPLNSNKLLELQNALSDTPYFGRVEVTPDREEAVDRSVPIVVDLQPSKPWRFRFGLGYGTDTGPRGSVNVQARRINSEGHRGELDVVGSAVEQSASAKYLIPGAYPRTDVWTISAGYAHLQPTTSNSQTAFVGGDYSFALGHWRESLSLGYARDKFTVGLDDGTSGLLTPGSNTTRVVADDRIDARDGYRLQLRLMGASSAVGSTASFGQVYVAAKRIRPLGENNRLIARAELGWMTTPDFHSLPPRVRFFAGGDASVRGYKYQSLGETDAAGNVIGGKTLETLSIELEHRFLPKWGAAVFFDAGNALDRLSLDLKKGVGVGARWVSPVGPVRLDFAYGLDDPRGFRVHVNIGPDL